MTVAVGAGSRHSPQILEMAFVESGLLGSLLFPADAFEPVPAEGSEQAVYSYHARSRLKKLCHGTEHPRNISDSACI